MDQNTRFIFTTIDHMKNYQGDDNTQRVENETQATIPRMIFKTWLRLKVKRWQIEIKRASHATQEAPEVSASNA